MKLILEKSDINSLIAKINPKLEIEEWTEEGILINSNLDGFKGKFLLSLKLDNISQKAELDLKLKL